MKLHHMLLAALTSIVWGLAFVATKLGLESFSAPQLTALRFLIAALPALVVPRPQIGWGALVAIGLTLFTGQFLLLFFAFEAGLPPGLASVTQQMQVFFTVLLAATFVGDVPSLRQCAGLVVAFAGLAVIGLTVGADLKPLALGLALAGALSWAVGNVLVKRTSTGVPLFSLIVWASLVPPLPALAISAMHGTGPSFLTALLNASWGRARRRDLSRRRGDTCLRDLGRSAATLSGRHGGAVRTAVALRRNPFIGAGLWRAVQSAALRWHGTYTCRSCHHFAAGFDTDIGPPSRASGWYRLVELRVQSQTRMGWLIGVAV